MINQLWPGVYVGVRPSLHLPVHGDPVALRAGASARVASWRESLRPAGPRLVPAAEVPIRQALRAEMPQSAVGLAELAAALGWSAYARFTRGPWRNGATDRGAWNMGNRIILNLWRPRVRAVATYANGLSTGAMWWPEGSLPQPVGIERLQALISGSG